MDFERRYFDEIYGGAYDRRNPRWKTRPLLRAIEQAAPGGRLLDVGCAYGAFLCEASRSGRYELAGTDISEHAIDIATERLAGRDVDLRVGGLFDSGHPDGSFDVLCMFDVIEHLPDLDAAFAQVRRLLRPDGLFAMSVPVYDGAVGRLVGLLDKDPTHLHKLARGAWVDACGQAGFEVRSWIGLWRYLAAGRVYLYFQSRFGRQRSPAVLVLARAGGCHA
jgi:SAM-dependent methyltransferase